MAQLMRMPVTQPRTLAQPDEGVREVVRVHRGADLAGEDQPVIPPQRPGRHLGLGLARPVLPAGLVLPRRCYLASGPADQGPASVSGPARGQVRFRTCYSSLNGI